MSQKLSNANWMNFLHGLNLANNPPFNQQVKPKPLFKPQVVIDDCNRLLTANFQSHLAKFMSQTYFIDTLQKSGTKRFVNREGCVHN